MTKLSGDDEESTPILTSDDIFENVFNYDFNYDEEDATNNNNCHNTFYEQPPTHISLSLRNSLLKLMQSRRHLAALITEASTTAAGTNKNRHNHHHNNNKSNAKSNGSSTTSSSTTSSLTSSNGGSHMHRHMGGGGGLSSRKPCVYMLNEGRCARADCRFVHDLKTITCKYWLEGECLKGETCEFAHEFIAQTNHDDDARSATSSGGECFSHTHTHTQTH
jgi:hypothetical protein